MNFLKIFRQNSCFVVAAYVGTSILSLSDTMVYQSECVLQVYYQLGNKPDGLKQPEIAVLRNGAFISYSL